VLIKKAHASKVSQQTRIDLMSKLAKEQSRIAELDSYIKFTPRLVYQHTNDGGDFLGLGISIPLPFWNRNQGEIMRANAEVKSTKSKHNYFNDGGFEIQIKIMRAAAFAAQEQVKIFYNKVIPSFKAALSAQEKLYQQGNSNPVQVWQTFKSLNDAQSQALELWLNATLLRSQLSIFIGEII
jgi:outer membrane protein TolC